ncbi:hypothetical protein Trisim1_000318 [Trichoderma cf. simile WF8]
MSPNTRPRRHNQNQITVPLVIASSSNNRVEKAKQAVCSLNLSEDKTEHIRQVWQELRRSYESTFSNADEPFPFWALRQFKSERLERILELGYDKDLGQLRNWAACAAKKFDVKPSRFVLFFDSIEQARAKALNKVSKECPSLTFDSLYQAVQRNRLRRIKCGKNRRNEFLPGDFNACWKRINNDDSSNYNSDDVEENDEDEDGERENSCRSPIESTGFNDQESDCMITHDVQTPSDHGEGHGEGHVEAEDGLDIESGYSIHTGQPGLPITLDETDASGDTMTPRTPTHESNERTKETCSTYPSQDIDPMARISTVGNTPSVTTNHVEDEARRRDTNHEESSSLDPHSNTGKIMSIGKQLLQQGGLIFFELKELWEKTEAAENCVKTIENTICANAEQIRQITLQPLQSDQSASSEDMISAIAPVTFVTESEYKKRKIEHEKIAEFEVKRVKLVAEFVAKMQEFGALDGSDVRGRGAASANLLP